MSIFNRKPKLNLPERVVHWIRQAPTFALIDTNEEALAVAHSLDSIIQGREHIQAHILLLRDRVAQDQARIVELETLMNETSRAILKRDDDNDTSPTSGGRTSELPARTSASLPSSNVRDQVTTNAREAYKGGNGNKQTLKLADAGAALKAAVGAL